VPGHHSDLHRSSTNSFASTLLALGLNVNYDLFYGNLLFLAVPLRVVTFQICFCNPGGKDPSPVQHVSINLTSIGAPRSSTLTAPVRIPLPPPEFNTYGSIKNSSAQIQWIARSMSRPYLPTPADFHRLSIIVLKGHPTLSVLEQSGTDQTPILLAVSALGSEDETHLVGPTRKENGTEPSFETYSHPFNMKTQTHMGYRPSRLKQTGHASWGAQNKLTRSPSYRRLTGWSGRNQISWTFL